jgi:hypothetical protein
MVLAGRTIMVPVRKGSCCRIVCCRCVTDSMFNFEGGVMIKCDLHLPDKRIIPVKIKERHYKKLTAEIKNLSFRQKIKLLFGGKK